MAIIKCKMCGGDLNITEGMTVAECEYCGTKQTVPNVDNEKKTGLFLRAEKLRRDCDFDRAAAIYDSILTDFPAEPEAYWGLLLCKYGIEYVDDPATGKKVPTCHRSSFDSVMEDENLEKVMDCADTVARKVYRDEAKAIEEIRKGILEVSGKEPPYRDAALKLHEKLKEEQRERERQQEEARRREQEKQEEANRQKEAEQAKKDAEAAERRRREEAEKKLYKRYQEKYPELQKKEAYMAQLQAARQKQDELPGIIKQLRIFPLWGLLLVVLGGVFAVLDIVIVGIVLSLIGVIMCCMAISEISKQKKQQYALTEKIDALQDKLRAVEAIPSFEEFCRSEEAAGVQ